MDARQTSKPSRLRLAAAVSMGAAVAMTGLAVWWFASLRPERDEALLRGRVGGHLVVLSGLEERHRAARGAYSSDLEALARISGDPEGLKAALRRDLDLETLLVSGDRTRYLIEANCLDSRRTRIRLEGPPGSRS